MSLMLLTVRGSTRQAVVAAVRRQISFVPQDSCAGEVTGWVPLKEANKVLAWYAESGHARLLNLDCRAGSLVSYEWPEEN